MKRSAYHTTRPVSGKKLRVHAGLLFVQLTFGAFPVVGKGVLAILHPLSLAGLRVIFATPLLLFVAWRVERVRPTRRHLPVLALLGLLGMFANQVLYILGLARTTAGNAGILMPSIPVFALAVAALSGVERLTWRRCIGVSLAVAGAVAMLDPTNLSLRSGTTVGNALILANCLSYAIYLVLQRPVLRQLPPLTVVAWAYLFGSLGVLAVSAPSLASTAWAAVPPTVWLGVAYIVLIPTSVNYVINSWAIRRSSPALVAAYSLLQPVVAAGLGVLFLAEGIGARELAGFALIVTGLWGVSRGNVRGEAGERRD
jgi:drug/metabolite transporter (DMT)-like permease